jgi:hypothetical protein
MYYVICSVIRPRDHIYSVNFFTSLNSCFKFDGCLLLLIDGVAAVVVPAANSEEISLDLVLRRP